MPLPPTVILASGSPRRRELLAELGVAFDVRPPDVDETPRPGEGAADLVHRLAVAKAQAGLEAAPEGEVVVLAADTAVEVAGEVLGKPIDADDARRMLRLLSGTRHHVHTGVAVARRAGDVEPGDVEPGDGVLLAPAIGLESAVATTYVTMRPWSDAEVEAYVASGEPMDKAGSYAIQEVGDRFVEAVDGRFDNVVGLPLDVCARLLAEAGVAVAQPPDV